MQITRRWVSPVVGGAASPSRVCRPVPSAPTATMSSADVLPGHRVDGELAAGYLSDLQAALGPLDPDARVLEIGCGDGLFTSVLASRFRRVVAIDRDAERVAAARRRLPDVVFQHADLEGSPDDLPRALGAGAFDLVASRFAVHELADPLATFSALRRHLAPGGRMVVIENCWARSDWHDDGWSGAANSLPLAYTQTWATVAYMLENVGYHGARGRWMDVVNAADEIKRNGYRLYVVTAEAGSS